MFLVFAQTSLIGLTYVSFLYLAKLYISLAFQIDTDELEIPKALGDIFESAAGAVYVDSGMSLDAVWTVFKPLMLPLFRHFNGAIPKSPVRVLLEAEPECVQFQPPERLLNGRFKVVVNVAGYGQFDGTGRNYRIAKNIAARRALKSMQSRSVIIN